MTWKEGGRKEEEERKEGKKKGGRKKEGKRKEKKWKGILPFLAGAIIPWVINRRSGN